MVMTTKPAVVNYITYPFAFWDNWLSEDEIKSIERYCTEQGTEEATVVGHDGESIKDTNIRSSSTKMIVPNEHTGWIFDRLINIANHLNNQFYQYDLQGFDYFQYTEYNGVGSEYQYHTDMIIGDKIPSHMQIPRKLSFSVILSDPSEYEGGELEFRLDGGNPVEAEQKRGRIIAFPSFMLHRVAPLKSGQRRSLVFWAVGPKFK